ncbi:MAG: fumarate hydratase [Candidatus Magnetominusculus sp. LBB02]|nr:fumarate hydratase [Candidatus Magnetominusculus sp. LBB02]
MLKLIDGIVELYKKVASSVPPDVEKAIAAACEAELPDSPGRGALSALADKIKTARTAKKPVCCDAGLPVFWIKIPRGLSQKEIGEIVIAGTMAAAKKIDFHAEGVLQSIMASQAEGYPIINFEEWEGASLVIDLLLNGTDCENAGTLFSCPPDGLTDSGVIAPRGYEVIAECIEQTLSGADNMLCFPLIVGVSAASAREQAVSLSKRQLMRKLNDVNPQRRVNEFESQTMMSINNAKRSHGLATTMLGIKMALAPIHPASFFVDVSISCWALRRGRLIWS